jgi:hypothetical protein
MFLFVLNREMPSAMSFEREVAHRSKKICGGITTINFSSTFVESHLQASLPGACNGKKARTGFPNWRCASGQSARTHRFHPGEMCFRGVTERPPVGATRAGARLKQWTRAHNRIPPAKAPQQSYATRSQTISWCCIVPPHSRRGGLSRRWSPSKRTWRTCSPPTRLASEEASTFVTSVLPSKV